MRTLFFLVVLLGGWNICFAQEEQLRADKLKLAISFGNQVEMAFDNIERSHQIFKFREHLEDEVEDDLFNGDYFLNNGKAQKSIKSYQSAFELILPNDPTSLKGKPLDIFKISQAQDKRFTQAEKLLKRADQQNLSRERALLLASAINGMAVYYHHIGNIKVAEQLYLKALEIRGAQMGKSSEYYVSTLHNLAILRKDQGRYDAAEDMLKYVIRFYEKIRSKTSYQYAVAVNNQAMLYTNMGRTEDAIALLGNLFNNSEPVVFPATSFDKARMITNRALFEIERKNSDEAVILLNEALHEFKLKGAIKHPDYQKIKLYLAQVQLLKGNLAFLKDFLDATLDEIRNDLGAENLAYAHAQEIKAEYLFQTNDFNGALSIYQSIAALRASKLGLLHKDYLRVMNKVATCQWKLGNQLGAFQNFRLVAESYLDVVNKYFYNMSEKEKTQFWNDLKPQIDVFYSFALHSYKNIPELLPYAYDLRLKTKGLLLLNTNKIRDAINSQSESGLSELYKEWLATKETLATYYSMDKETIASMDIDVAALEADANDMEKNINRLVSGNESVSGFATATSRLVATALQPDQLAIEIIRVSNAYGTEFTEDQYCALILSADQRVQLVMIGSAKDLETKWGVFYKNAILARTSETKTYDMFWKPMLAGIGNHKHIFLSPDAVYNLINVNSLLGGDGHYVIDDFEIEVVPNTGVLTNTVNKLDNEQVVLIGNPTFGSTDIAQLPGTEKEIIAIQQLVKSNTTVVMTESEATENSLKEVSKPKILHIATHGFFMNDVDEREGENLSRTLNKVNPLMRSGLLLAGAGSSRKQFSDESSDGVFTAYEAMNLNLQNTDLVTLSACETGKGEVINGEGVYGLSRAFTIAGARNLIMSLWKVDDNATQELMSAFYAAWLTSGDLKSSFVIAQRQLKQKYNDPYYWAAFVLVTSK